jgi:hypothetical protein
MESNPEEFYDKSIRNRRWDKIMQEYESYYSEEERLALKTKYAELQLERMHKDVMAELLHGEEDKNEYEHIENKLGLKLGTITGITVGGNINIPPGQFYDTKATLRVGSEELNESMIKKIKGLISK